MPNLLTVFVSTGLAVAGLTACSSDKKDDAKKPPAAETGPDCATEFDKAKFPDKHATCIECEKQHRGMGSMEADCKNDIEKPWK